ELKARDWKEEVEERLIHEPARRRKKPPKRTWREELNLDFLAEHGPQWWLVRVSMAPGTDYVDLITKAVARRFSEVSFKIYNPAIQVKKRLKSGLISTKSKPLHPGLVFLYCTLNKELHDFIRDTEGCYGFIGATRGSMWVLLSTFIKPLSETLFALCFDVLVRIIHALAYTALLDSLPPWIFQVFAI
uniref:NusG-like N-terminal domain-containing protein n=1 Tax=Aegilops tauschii subsp. strangulata TaxID=200361 RepID=A0A453MBM6_AEGTS